MPPGHPKVDPIHQFADGEKDGVPFTCPFMAAFKEAKKKESAKEEEEVPEGNAVLEQFSDMMAGYEEFKRNKEMAAAKAEDGKCTVRRSHTVLYDSIPIFLAFSQLTIIFHTF